MRPGVAPATVALAFGLMSALVAAPAPAHAGRTHYGWLFGSEVIPEGSVELETWIFERNERKKGDATDGTDETSVWWAPVIGITEHLELAIPIEMTWIDPPSTTQLVRWGGELRYRINSMDPETAGPVSALIRAGVKRVIAQRDAVRGEGDIVVAFESGRVHAEIDLGAIATTDEANTIAEVRPGAGISVRVHQDLRFGVETYGEIGVRGEVVDWMAAGPTVGWTQGRFWLSGTLGVGLFGVRTAPRLNFAVAF